MRLFLVLMFLMSFLIGSNCNKEYIVKSGDSLSKISNLVYSDESKWDIIYYQNKQIIGDKPSNLKVGIKLLVPCLNDIKFEPTTETKKRTYHIEFLAGDGFAPFKDRNSPNGGMGTEILKETMALLPNVSYEIDWINDFSSHLDPLLKKHKYDASYTWFKPDCSNLAKLSKQTQVRCEFLFSKPMYKDLVVMFIRKDSNFKLKSFKDLANKRVCRPKGYFIFDLEKAVNKSKIPLNLIQPDKVDDCFIKLVNNDVDIVSINKLTGMQSVKDLKIKDKVHSIESLTTTQEMCFIVHKSHPFAKEYIKLFNEGLDKLKKSGKLFKIQQKHLINFYNKL